MSAGARLRASLHAGQVLAPGCGDALSAKLIERTGFEAACMSGGWTAAGRGLPDSGLITLDEMVANATYIARGVDIPVIADADTGFGGELNVRRTVSEFEHAGVAGIHLEDQALPKKCGLMKGKAIVPVDEMIRKLEAAIGARNDPDFLIIARTDALEPEGLVSTVARGHAYLAAGADMLMVEGLRTEAEICSVGKEFADFDLCFNRTPRGYAPFMPLDLLAKWGFNFIVYPMQLALHAVFSQIELLTELQETGGCTSFEDRMLSFREFFDLVGEEIVAVEP